MNEEVDYFFTMLTDRFEPLNIQWQQNLEKRYQKKFKPVYVLPFRHNAFFEEENYIVLNERLKQLHIDEGRSDVINLIYPEDLNKQFSESALIKDLIDRMLQRQDKVFIVGFTTVWLDIPNPKVVILGPDPIIAAKFDDKAEHIRTFRKLGFEINEAHIYKDFAELRESHIQFPCFVSATYSSGGIESTIIESREKLDIYYDSLRPINQVHPFIAAKLLDDIVLAPNTSALVAGENKTILTLLLDQFLRCNNYMGNIYRSRASKEMKQKMEVMTRKVGDYLSVQGFRGMFGMDFLITGNGDCFPVDINPRHQGGYFCNVMTSAIDLVDLELRVALGEDIPSPKAEDFDIDYAWAHSKLSPFKSNIRIIEDIRQGDATEPFNKIGSSYSASYYPKNHTLILGNPGFYLVTNQDRKIVEIDIKESVASLISELYE